MSATVRIESEVWGDWRFRALAQSLGCEWHAAIGKMAHLWGECTRRDSHYLSARVCAAILGCSPDDAEGILQDADLGEPTPEGVRIKGTEGRIEWLGQKRRAGRKGGKARVAKDQKRRQSVMTPTLAQAESSNEHDVLTQAPSSTPGLLKPTATATATATALGEVSPRPSLPSQWAGPTDSGSVAHLAEPVTRLGPHRGVTQGTPLDGQRVEHEDQPAPKPKRKGRSRGKTTHSGDSLARELVGVVNRLANRSGQRAFSPVADYTRVLGAKLYAEMGARNIDANTVRAVVEFRYERLMAISPKHCIPSTLLNGKLLTEWLGKYEDSQKIDPHQRPREKRMISADSYRGRDL